MSEHFPKVLFCTSEVPQSVNAGSMQLFRVLRDYPANRLMVLGVPPENDAKLLPCRYESLRLVNYRLACTRFRGWSTGLNALNTLFELQIRRSERLAREFDPDLIVTVMDKLSYYKHAWALARRVGAPLLTITMDDPQTFESAHPFLEGAFVRFLRRMYGDAAMSLGVSREMCEYLDLRFGKKSEVFYFGPPEGIEPRPPEESASLKSPRRLTLGYAGSLGLGYREGLMAIVSALEVTGTTLHVYTRDQHCLIRHPQVVNRGYLAPEALWHTVKTECDAVLLPYAFGGPITKVYRTHFPTKLSEYCWIGMPIVIVGPGDASGVRWGLRHPDVSLTSLSPSIECLSPLLDRLTRDSKLRVGMAQAASELARSEFDPIIIKQQFVELIRRAAFGREPAFDRAQA